MARRLRRRLHGPFSLLSVSSPAGVGGGKITPRALSVEEEVTSEDLADSKWGQKIEFTREFPNFKSLQE